MIFGANRPLTRRTRNSALGFHEGASGGVTGAERGVRVDRRRDPARVSPPRPYRRRSKTHVGSHRDNTQLDFAERRRGRSSLGVVRDRGDLSDKSEGAIGGDGRVGSCGTRSRSRPRGVAPRLAASSSGATRSRRHALSRARAQPPPRARPQRRPHITRRGIPPRSPGRRPIPPRARPTNRRTAASHSRSSKRIHRRLRRRITRPRRRCTSRARRRGTQPTATPRARWAPWPAAASHSRRSTSRCSSSR